MIVTHFSKLFIFWPICVLKIMLLYNSRTVYFALSDSTMNHITSRKVIGLLRPIRCLATSILYANRPTDS